MIWNEARECMSREQLMDLQGRRLHAIVDKVYHNVAYYRKKMQEQGLEPGDIRTVEDIEKLPFTTKDDLREAYPYGALAVDLSEIVRVHTSSGSTGKFTVVGYTAKDIVTWNECMARCIAASDLGKNDIIQVAYRYGLFTGGLGAHYGAEYMGATVIPTSTGNADNILSLTAELKATGIMCTPSLLLHLADRLEEKKIEPLQLKTAICGAEACTERMRQRIKQKLNIDIYDVYGISEIMGPGVACECESHDGLHVQEDHFLAEIVDIKTGKKVRDGLSGELVLTTLTKEGMPLLRYRTKDLTSMTHEKCKCGRTTARINSVCERNDDMLLIRGVKVFPGQIGAILGEMEEVSDRYLLTVDSVHNLDYVEIQIETEKETLLQNEETVEAVTERITRAIQTRTGIHIAVKLVKPQELERYGDKPQMIVDNRAIWE